MWNDMQCYLARLKLEYQPSTVKEKSKMMKLFLRWLIEKKLHYSELTRQHAWEYMRWRPWGAMTRNKHRFMLNRFYGFMEIPSPFAHIPRALKRPYHLPKMPAERTIQRLIDKIDSKNDEIVIRNRLMVELAYGSGLRRGELVRLNVEDIDWSSSCAHVTGKGNKQRIVPLTAKTLDLLREYLPTRRHLRARGPLLQNFYTGRRLNPETLGELCKVTTGHNTHSFRHACATHMMTNGCDTRYIQELLGHKDLKTTQIYTHVDRSSLQRVLMRAHPRAQVA